MADYIQATMYDDESNEKAQVVMSATADKFEFDCEPLVGMMGAAAALAVSLSERTSSTYHEYDRRNSFRRLPKSPSQETQSAKYGSADCPACLPIDTEPHANPKLLQDLEPPAAGAVAIVTVGCTIASADKV